MPSLRRPLLALFLVVIAAAPAWAVIEVVTDLSRISGGDSDAIAVLVVEKVSERGIVLNAERDLKGQLPERRIALGLAGVKAEEATALTKRVAAGTQVVFFYTDTGAARQGLLYTDGSWFSALGAVEGEKTRWQLTQAEPYHRRVFRDSTEALSTLIAAAQQDAKLYPPRDPKAPPGLGPELGAPDLPPVEDPGTAKNVAAPTRPVPTLTPPIAPPEPSAPSRWLPAGLVVIATLIALAFNLRLS